MRPVPPPEVLLARLLPWIDCGPKGSARNRLLPAPLVVALLVLQALCRNLSCRGVLALLGARLGLDAVPSSSAYCQARARLSAKQLDAADRALAGRAPQWRGTRFAGRALKALDSTTFTVLDTAQNRAAWSCPSGQREGCGFPVLSCLAVRELCSGRMLALSLARWSAHDMRLFRGAPAPFARGDVLLADRAFDAFVFYAAVLAGGADAICRLKDRHRRFLSATVRLARNERLLRLRRPKHSSTVPKAALRALPETIRLRLVHARIRVRGFRDEEIWIATTLLDRRAFPARDILWAYERRWQIELAFRDVKSSMDGELLRVASPDMARKAVRAFFLASNFVRILFQLSGLEDDARILSFKAALPVATDFLLRLLGGEDARTSLARLQPILRSLLFQRRKRPPQPRVRKRRRDRYPFLTAPRGEYIEIMHPKKYRKHA